MTDSRLRRLRAELLSPAELDAAIAAHPIAFLPLGTLEFHGPHLPIGLDALNAHGVCLEAAAQCGGIVLPPVYQGVGGGHSDYPWTIMMREESGLSAYLEQTLAKLQSFGVHLAVVFTGHFAEQQLSMIDNLAETWNAAGNRMSVYATGVNRSDVELPPDHAGVFESTLLHSFAPELVHLDRLPDRTAHPDWGRNASGAQRHDPSHPLWGVFGQDPREANLDESRELGIAVVSWLSREIARRRP